VSRSNRHVWLVQITGDTNDTYACSSAIKAGAELVRLRTGVEDDGTHQPELHKLVMHYAQQLHQRGPQSVIVEGEDSLAKAWRVRVI
jgi:hypothetical protein